MTLHIDRAHPRAYGENADLVLNHAGTWGSSPRIRGKLADALTEDTTSGLIPAHTGKTPPVQADLGRSGAHPRAYGENTS